MKRIFNIILCAGLLALASCANNRNVDAGTESTQTGDKGAVTLNVDSRAVTDTTLEYVLRIYQKGADKNMLVRRYTSSEELPPYIWLVAGNYVATIECGKPEAASFDNSYYYGESDFTIEGGKTTQVDLVAVLQNIPVEVAFDQTVVEGFEEGYYVDVVATADLASATVDTPQLRYTESKTGYFVMPEGETTLSWRFVGTFVYADGEKVSVDKSGKIENVEVKKHYTLSFKYSKDASGFLGDITVTVDTSVDERDDHLAFNPDPEVRGVGFDLATSCNYAGGERQYLATSPAEFVGVTLVAGGKTFDPATTTVEGVTLSGLNTPQLYITLSDKFFNVLSGGEQTIELSVFDSDGGSATKQLPYVLQGVNTYKKSGTDLWNGTSLLTATVFGTPSNVQIMYRSVGESEWKAYAATASATANTYEATVNGISPSTSYEYNLSIDGATVGTSLTFTTVAGAQIPNGDMEGWCEQGGVIIPFSTPANSYWCTGNWGTAALSKNITQSSTDVRPGSTGSKSAYLKSEYIVVKFAAGNIYVGAWGGMNGMDATVYFGQPFEYNAKPKAFRFWAKFKCGTIDQVKGGVGVKGEPDLTKIFCALTTDRHTVESSNASATTFSPSDTEIKSGDARYDKVLYSAYMETTTSNEEWTLYEVPFTFYGDDPTVKPSHMILTFTCSGYGDFFDGSTESYMYIDDIELVY